MVAVGKYYRPCDYVNGSIWGSKPPSKEEMERRKMEEQVLEQNITQMLQITELLWGGE